MRRLAFLVLALCATAASADEGMWQPAQLPQIASQLKQRGLQLDPRALSDLTAHPMDAIIGLGFCSAAFVSSEGLIVTNHHCAYGSIQYHSTTDRDLLQQGFLAATRGDELPAVPAVRVYVTRAITDVTERINAGLNPRMSGAERHAAIEAEEKRIIAECEAEPGHRCKVHSFFGGHRYQLVRQLELRDVRLVYAPPAAVGRFGGDVDNWMWPRHTGDFAFFRAYAAPDGSPADPAPDNVPFAPDSHLEINPQGIAAGDYVMVIGYPGRTARYRRGMEVAEAIEWTYPTRRDTYADWVRVITQAAADDPEARIRYASVLSSLNNAVKNAAGMLDGFARDDVVARRGQQAAALRAWIERSQTYSSLYLDDLIDLDDTLQRQQRLERRLFRYHAIVKRAGLLNAARTLYRLARERRKPDIERKLGFQQRDVAHIRSRLQQLQRRYHPTVDRSLLAYNIRRYAEQPPDQRMAALDNWLGIRGVEDPSLEHKEAQLDALHEHTRLDDAGERLAWLDREVAAFDSSDDPFIALAVALSETDLELEAEEEALAGDLQRLRASYMDALLTWQREQGVAVYDDANGSLRVSFGTVRGYDPADGVRYLPFTTLPGMVAKHTGIDPFDATQRQIDLIRGEELGPYASETLGTVPVNFLADLDITGGNSGSATLDGAGKLVGLVFDGNHESIYSDWAFNAELTRSIHVDIRYMLWVMDAVDQADHLLREMGIEGAL